MKKNNLLITLVLALSAPCALHASIARSINYQGFLLNSGTRVPLDTPQDMRFVLCDSENGSCASPLFTEDFCNVPVNKGRFDVRIGSVAVIADSVFQNNSVVWLERRLDPDDGCDTFTEIFSPRMRIQSAGYAFQALHADTSTITNNVATATLSGTYNFTNTNSSFTATEYKAGIYRLTETGFSRIQDVLQPAPFPLATLLPRSATGVEGSSLTFQAGLANSGGTASPLRGGEIILRGGEGDNAAGGNVLLESGLVSTQSPAQSSSTVIIRSAATGTNLAGAEIKVISGLSQGGGSNNIPGGYIQITAGNGTGTGRGGSIVMTPGTGTGDGGVGIGAANPAAKLHMSSGTLLVDGNAATAFRVGASSFIVNSDGEVGIGTASPGSALEVVGRISHSLGLISAGVGNGATAGNARGTGANDLQTERALAAQVASGNYAVISGGNRNSATNTNATVAGGWTNSASNTYAVVGGGRANTASGSDSAIGGGQSNTANGTESTVGGGFNNTASATQSTVGGGTNNTANAQAGTVGGGDNNTAGIYGTVAGGSNNTATGSRSMVPGGDLNDATGLYSFAAGRRAKAATDGSFVWGDSQDANVTATLPNQFMVRAQGGFYLAASSITLVNGAQLIATGATPAPSVCGGGSPSVTGTDMAGKLTIGTGVTTSCIVTFAKAYANAPACVITGDNNAVTYSATTSATQMIVTSSADMGSDVISYICIGL